MCEVGSEYDPKQTSKRKQTHVVGSIFCNSGCRYRVEFYQTIYVAKNIERKRLD